MEDLKCAHEPCTCTVEVGEQYCSRACKEDANGTGGEIETAHGACRCRHSECEAR
jgi:hypothetical protein